MKLGSLLTMLQFVSWIYLASFCQGSEMHKHHQRTHSPGPYRVRIIDPGDISTDQRDPDCKAPLSAVVRLHLSSKLLTGANTGDICGIVGTGISTQCVAWLPPAKDNSNDDDGGEPERESYDLPVPQPSQTQPNKGSTVNWQTPLDIDLSNHWISGSKKGTWNPILIKVILDDDVLSFLTPRSDLTDVSKTVLQGAEGKGMFKCLIEKSTKDTVDNTRPVIKLRVIYSGSYGGLNIGIKAPFPLATSSSSSAQTLYFPLFIDPQLHNHGQSLIR